MPKALNKIPKDLNKIPKALNKIPKALNIKPKADFYIYSMSPMGHRRIQPVLSEYICIWLSS